jgi:Copper type II ascorbate-dependent monooxygenase, C-terminal domain
MKNIQKELGYQSESQEILYMDPKRRVRATDNLALECEFNSQDRDRTVLV